jgi:hypothetical protein
MTGGTQHDRGADMRVAAQESGSAPEWSSPWGGDQESHTGERVESS